MSCCAEPRGRVALALGDVAAPLLRDPALLVGELRDRVGARTRERRLELGRALLDLLRHDLVEGGASALDRRGRAGARAPSPCGARARTRRARCPRARLRRRRRSRRQSRRHRRRAATSATASATDRPGQEPQRALERLDAGGRPSLPPRAAAPASRASRCARLAANANAAAATASSRIVCASTK